MERTWLQGVLVGFDQGTQIRQEVQLGHSQVFPQVGQESYMYELQDHKPDQIDKGFGLEFRMHIWRKKAHKHLEPLGIHRTGKDILLHSEWEYYQLHVHHSLCSNYMSNGYELLQLKL